MSFFFSFISLVIWCLICTFLYCSVLNYSDTNPNINMLPILKRIVQNHIPVWVSSGDQDSVVPRFSNTHSWLGWWPEVRDYSPIWSLVPQSPSWRLGNFEYGNLLTFATIYTGSSSHDTLYTTFSSTASIQFLFFFGYNLFSSFVNGRRLPYTTRPSIWISFRLEPINNTSDNSNKFRKKLNKDW